MRWKVHLFEINNIHQSNSLLYIFKSRKTPPQEKDLIAFENDLVKLKQNVTFEHISNNFQDQMRTDIESIKRSKNIYIFADKFNNLYESDIKNYNKLLMNKVSKVYKKSDLTIFNTINREAKNIAK